MNNETDKKIDAIFQSILGDLEGFHNGQPKAIDSVAYVELLITFQNEFKIKFSTQEFFSLRSVENIRKSVHVKISS
jgi:acyl carrier protein